MNIEYILKDIGRQYFAGRTIFEYTTHSTQRIARRLAEQGFFKSLNRIGVPRYRLTEKGLAEIVVNGL